MIADWLAGLWVVIGAISLYAARRTIELMDQRGLPSTLRQLVVICPVKGLTAATGPFIERLMAQDHPNYRVIFALQDERDPAYPIIAPLHHAAAPRVEIVLAGPSLGCSQKVWNQTIALDNLRPSDQLVVFADADILPPPGWLSHLDWAVIDEKQDIVTGYRLIVPCERNLASYAVASLNLSIAASPRPGRLSLAWGGTMALTQETMRRIGLRKAWYGALSDDGALSDAARSGGVPITTQRRLLLESPWNGGIKDAFYFGRRQFMVMRMHRPMTYWLAMAIMLVSAGGLLASLYGAVHLKPWAIGCLVAGTAFAYSRAGLRADIVRIALGDRAGPDVQRWLVFDRWFRPVWFCLLPAVMIGALVGRRMTWAGITYEWTPDLGAKVIRRGG